MIRVEQDLPDNCLAACFASVLEVPLSEIPNFARCGEAWFVDALAWFAPMNISLAFVGYDEGLRSPAGYAILTVQSIRGPFQHCVVAKDGEIVWDPSPRRTDGIGKKLFWTVFTVLDPSRSTVKSAVKNWSYL